MWLRGVNENGGGAGAGVAGVCVHMKRGKLLGGMGSEQGHRCANEVMICKGMGMVKMGRAHARRRKRRVCVCGQMRDVRGGAGVCVVCGGWWLVQNVQEWVGQGKVMRCGACRFRRYKGGVRGA